LQLNFDLLRQTGVEFKNKEDMKQYLIAIAMVLALSSNANATAQKHRHTPRTEQVSDTVKHNQGSIEAFSDTTATTSNANVDDDDYTYRRHVTFEADGEEAAHVVKSVLEDMGGSFVLIPILAILCFGFFLPIIIVLLVFYFINRNRKEKYRLAQMAIQNGQPIPDQLLKDSAAETFADNSMYNAGIRQMFTGIGLAIFLGIIIDELGVGIGALVFFIGLGKFIIARQSRKNTEDLKNMNRDFENNNPKNEEL
jgi:preprotein translocase subunit YajC